MHVYFVQPGDTLEGLARRFRVTPDRLSLCNDLPHSSFLLPGHALCIPSQLELQGTENYSTYQIQPGDSLRSISETWQIPVTWLAFCNQLSDPALTPGDIMLLPHTEMRSSSKPFLRLLSLEQSASTDRRTTLLTYQARPQLRVSASGHVHFPTRTAELSEAPQDPFPKQLMICSLDGSENILPDVARAILRSDHAQNRILEGLASGLRNAGGTGVIFAWHPLRAESEVAYLEFVREAGRRLRPMGFTVGLHLTANSPLLKKRRAIESLTSMIDHYFYDPIPREASATQNAFATTPAPLIGIEELRQSLQVLAERLPLSKTWLILHPIGLITKRNHILQRLSPQQAIRLAYTEGIPLCRDAKSSLVWFRYTGSEGFCSVWTEDLGSLVRKLALLEELQVQGLAFWERDAHFPAAWNYLCEHYTASEGVE